MKNAETTPMVPIKTKYVDFGLHARSNDRNDLKPPIAS